MYFHSSKLFFISITYYPIEFNSYSYWRWKMNNFIKRPKSINALLVLHLYSQYSSILIFLVFFLIFCKVVSSIFSKNSTYFLFRLAPLELLAGVKEQIVWRWKYKWVASFLEDRLILAGSTTPSIYLCMKNVIILVIS